MKKVLILLAVAALSAASGCCCTQLCPLCPCNWFNRGAYCAPAPVYAAPLAASPCGPATFVPSPCGPTCAPVSPLAATVMPQFVAPPMGQMMTQAQPMYYSAPAAACCAPEPSCSYAAEQGCGGPFMGSVSYGPMMDCGCNQCGGGSQCGGCNQCGGYAPSGGCSSCDGGAPAAAAPAPEKFVEPTPERE